MKIYHSYWSAGYAGTPDPFVLDLHRLSAFLAKRAYGEVHLITDSRAAPTLGTLGYDSVSTDLDALPLQYAPVWSLGKIWSYIHLAAKGDPFCHIDYDVLLWRPLPLSFTSSPLFAERVELEVTQRYHLNLLYRNCPQLHDLQNLTPTEREGAINAGIVGGHNTAFLHEAFTKAWNFVMDPLNQAWMTGPPMGASWTRATIAEQFYFYHYARLHNQPIQYLLNSLTNRKKDADANSLGYTHIWGGKNNLNTRKRVRERCRELGLPTISEDFDIHWVAEKAEKVLKAMRTSETDLSRTRLSICQSCPQYAGSRCKLCGCFLSLKVKLPEEKCPLGKW